MSRIILIQIASFLLPFFIFFLWRLQSSKDAIKPTPFLKLSAAGGGLAVLIMIGLVIYEGVRGGQAGDCYIPAQMVDGRIESGYFTESDCPPAPDEATR